MDHDPTPDTRHPDSLTDSGQSRIIPAHVHTLPPFQIDDTRRSIRRSSNSTKRRLTSNFLSCSPLLSTTWRYLLDQKCGKDSKARATRRYIVPIKSTSIPPCLLSLHPSITLPHPHPSKSSTPVQTLTACAPRPPCPAPDAPRPSSCRRRPCPRPCRTAVHNTTISKPLIPPSPQPR